MRTFPLWLLLACGGDDPETSTTPDDTPTESDTGTDTGSDTPTTADTSSSGDTSPHTGTVPELPDELNVLMIVVDDLSWSGLSSSVVSEGNPSDYHQTPRLDQLADQGTVFTRTWAAPVCVPGRAIAVTGQHASTHTLYYNTLFTTDDPERLLHPADTSVQLPAAATTVAERFRDHGYRTGHFGKWHLGAVADGTDPLSQGFDINIGGNDEGKISGGGDGHFAQDDGSFIGLPGMGANGQAGQFSTDRLLDEAIAWLLDDPSQPTFMHLCPWAMHLPMQAPPEDIAHFDGLPLGTKHDNTVYAAMMWNLDRNLGRLFDTMEATDDPRAPGLSLADTTVVLLTSDNGGQGGYENVGIVLESREHHTNNLPLSGGKGTLYEGGMRVPMIVVGPTVPAAQSIQTPVQLADVVPTLLDLAGLPPAADVDGDSLVPLLQGKTWERDAVLYHWPTYMTADEGTWRSKPGSLIRDDQYKLWFDWETRTAALYDLDADITEQTDLSTSQRAIVEDMMGDLVGWLDDTDANLPFDKVTKEEVPLPNIP